MRSILLVLSGACALYAGQACLSPDTIWKMRAVADPEISPDGQSIVYVSSWTDVRDDTTYSNLRQITGSARGGQALTAGNFRDRNPHWSPDGSHLAYLSDRDTKGQIHIITLATREDRVLAGTTGASQIAWSPDGRNIAYMRFVESKPEWDPAMPAPPVGAEWAAPAVSITSLRWTFDGQGILKPGGVRIFVVPVSHGTPRQISADPYQHTSYLSEPELAWSSDGRSVLAPAVKGADGWAVFSGNQIYAFPVSGGEPRQLTRGEGYKAILRPSPDGKWVAYSGFAWKGQSYHVSRLHLLPADGGEARVLTADWDRDVTATTWSADSRHLYFLSDDHGAVNLYSADPDGGFRQLTRGAQHLGSFSISGQTGVALRSTSVQPNVLIRFPMETPEKIEAIDDPNQELWAACRLSLAEEVRYRSFDGKEIQGWILKPPGFRPDRRYPLLVSMHGGPHGSYGASFNFDLQMMAEHGYVVLYTNPRGSTGYGEAFGNIIQRRWPGDDIKDVLAGVDEVLKTGYIDEKRMAVMGGSGGGLMTAWMVGHTDRFRAAVALYPVTNWITHVGSDDNGVLIANVYRHGWPWEDPEDYIRHSPLFYAKNIKTPTMIISGDEDWRVPIAQSAEFYRALKVRGVDTVFVRVPGESHGIGKRPSHRVTVMVHTLAWLDRYIAVGAKDR